ncbi:hypothetical protein JCM4814A_78480 [Streptomyces phaeofaciens JCM 4814]|uniref:Uncharacterized protein n=1 Tax=Streptomyces phaeofaciens TaxID=68254 RepID=A0A918HT96_9ACTN|nr:hypothetical protein GCM10010226_89990 [Streptomyces phaeofaciens]
MELLKVGWGTERDSRHTYSLSASESRFSNCWMRVTSRVWRAWALARSAWSEARLRRAEHVRVEHITRDHANSRRGIRQSDPLECQQGEFRLLVSERVHSPSGDLPGGAEDEDLASRDRTAPG